MSVLNAILNIEDKRLLSLYENENFDQIIRSTTKKIKLGKKDPNYFVLRALAFSARGKFRSAHNDFIQAKQLGLKNAIIEPLVSKNQIHSTFKKHFEKFLIDNENIDNLYVLGEVLENLDPNSIKSLSKTSYGQLSSLYMKLMDTNGSVTPHRLGLMAYKHLKLDPVINEFETYVENKIRSSREAQLSFLNQLSNNSLFARVLSYCVCTDRYIEIITRSVRRLFLAQENDVKISQKLFDLLSGVSVQMFLNEYVYDYSDDEQKRLSILISEVETLLSNNELPDEQALLKISLYQELSKFDLGEHRGKLKNLEPILRRHIDDRRSEKLIANSFEKNGLFNNQVSKRVKQQYEENPFPRWEHTKFNQRPKSLQSLIQSKRTKLKVQKLFSKQKLKALVAGCGTGQEPITVAKNLKNVQVDAVDLSIGSLSYAKRKANELNIQNIDFIHQDILNLANSKKKYHIINCSGVLHHMEEPNVGLGILSNLLEDQGFMQLALYSTKARHGLKQIQDTIIKEGNLKPDLNTIRQIREFLFTRAFIDKSIYPLSNLSDMFSTSHMRDLLFHEQEHTFSLLEVRDLLKENELEFCGFSITRNLPTEGLNDNTYFNLEHWHKIEQQKPELFISMYQFYCQRKQ